MAIQSALVFGLLLAVSLAAGWWWSRARRGRRSIASEPLARGASGDPGIVPESLHAHEALLRLHAFALDDAPLGELEGSAPLEADTWSRSVGAIFENLEARPEYTPRRPALLPRLLGAVNDGGASLREISATIGRDPALTGNLLRIANSPFYRVNETPVESLDRAVTRVGTDGIRSVIAAALLQPVMSIGTGKFAIFPEVIWQHTQYAAVAAEIHAREIESIDGFAAQLLALMQGLATNVVFRVARDQAVDQPAAAVPPVTFLRLLDRWVAPTARRIGVSWELPANVQAALAARERGEEQALTRSLQFGRVAGALIVLIREARLKEASARATLLAGDVRRVQIDRIWSRLAAAYVHGAR